VLVVAPLFHSLGLQILAIPALYVGASVVLQEGFDAARVWSTIESEGITYYGGVPTMHQRLLESLDRGSPRSAPPASLRFAFTAGAAASPTLIRAFHEHGLLVVQGYGQTETSILTCLEADRALSKAGSVGHPVPHVELRLVAPETIEGDIEDWHDVAPGAVGEVVARGPITMLGYFRRPEATAETLRGEWLRTGDLATRDQEFDITLVGRAREMYISGGENVYPAEVEATLVQHPGIEEVAVIAIPDPDWGEVGRAHVVPVPARTIDPETLSDWLKTRLARFKHPREFVIEATLPRTASGKVQKHLLKTSASTTAPEAPTSSEAPKTPATPMTRKP
jgi:fatty-acyl-CoA synthase